MVYPMHKHWLSLTFSPLPPSQHLCVLMYSTATQHQLNARKITQQSTPFKSSHITSIANHSVLQATTKVLIMLGAYFMMGMFGQYLLSSLLNINKIYNAAVLAFHTTLTHTHKPQQKRACTVFESRAWAISSHKWTQQDRLWIALCPARLSLTQTVPSRIDNNFSVRQAVLPHKLNPAGQTE